MASAWSIVNALLIASGTAGAEPTCISDVGAGLHKDVECSTVPAPGALGLHMHVTYNVPSQCLTTSCGLILDVHGLSMNADIEDANTNMRALGEQHSYIVAQPIATPDLIPFNHWGDHAEEALVGWAREALKVPDWQIDRSHVHFMGFSEGASLAWDMLARHADLFASIVVMEFGHTEFDPNMTQIPVLYQNGIYDANYLLAPITVERLREAWSTDAGTVVAGDGTFNRTRFIGNQGAPFEFLVHHYFADYILLGHCFPGSHDTRILPPPSGELPFFGPFGCPGALSKHKASYFIGDEAMKWFIAHPKKMTVV